MHTFPELTSNNTDIFRELLANNTTNLSRFFIIIKQYWRFQRVPSKLNYSKNFFQSSYHTILTISESYYQTVLTCSGLISNNFTLFQSYYQTIINFLWVSIDTWTDWKFSKRKFPSKSEKRYHTHMKLIVLPSTVCEFMWLVIDGFREENGLPPPSLPPKNKFRSPNTEGVQEIWNFPCP